MSLRRASIITGQAKMGACRRAISSGLRRDEADAQRRQMRYAGIFDGRSMKKPDDFARRMAVTSPALPAPRPARHGLDAISRVCRPPSAGYAPEDISPSNAGGRGLTSSSISSGAVEREWRIVKSLCR